MVKCGVVIILLLSFSLGHSLPAETTDAKRYQQLIEKRKELEEDMRRWRMKLELLKKERRKIIDNHFNMLHAMGPGALIGSFAGPIVFIHDARLCQERLSKLAGASLAISGFGTVVGAMGSMLYRTVKGYPDEKVDVIDKDIHLYESKIDTGKSELYYLNSDLDRVRSRLSYP